MTNVITLIGCSRQVHIHVDGRRQADERLALVFVAAGLAAAVASGSMSVTTRWRVTFALALAAPFLLFHAVLLAGLAQSISRSALFVRRSADAAQTLSRHLFRNGLELGHFFYYSIRRGLSVINYVIGENG